MERRDSSEATGSLNGDQQVSVSPEKNQLLLIQVPNSRGKQSERKGGAYTAPFLCLDRDALDQLGLGRGSSPRSHFSCPSWTAAGLPGAVVCSPP